MSGRETVDDREPASQFIGRTSGTFSVYCLPSQSNIVPNLSFPYPAPLYYHTIDHAAVNQNPVSAPDRIIVLTEGGVREEVSYRDAKNIELFCLHWRVYI